MFRDLCCDGLEAMSHVLANRIIIEATDSAHWRSELLRLEGDGGTKFTALERIRIPSWIKVDLYRFIVVVVVLSWRIDKDDFILWNDDLRINDGLMVDWVVDGEGFLLEQTRVLVDNQLQSMTWL